MVNQWWAWLHLHRRSQVRPVLVLLTRRPTIKRGINSSPTIITRMPRGKTGLVSKRHLLLFSPRSNAGTNGSSAVSLSHFSSPKNPSTYQQSPTVTSSGKALLSSVSNHSTSVPLHFTYPLSSSTSPSAVAAATTTATATTTTMSSTQPILPYSAIVSHNTAASTSTTTTSGNSTSKQQQHVLSPPTRQFSRQLSANNNETTTTTTSTFPNSSVTSSSSNNAHPSSPLVISNDRSGKYFTNETNLLDLSDALLFLQCCISLLAKRCIIVTIKGRCARISCQYWKRMRKKGLRLLSSLWNTRPPVPRRLSGATVSFHADDDLIFTSQRAFPFLSRFIDSTYSQQ